MRVKPASAKRTETFRRKLCQPFLIMTLNLSRSATVTIAAQNHSVTVIIHLHPIAIDTTLTQTPVTVRRSYCFHDDTVMTLLPPLSHTESAGSKGSRMLVRKTNTAGTDICECTSRFIDKNIH